MNRSTIHLHTRRGLNDITDQVAQLLPAGASGLCLVFIHHTSASLIVQENADADVQRDLEAFLSRLVPDGDSLFRHIEEGPDDMSAHVKSALTATSIVLPVEDGRLDLGTWQALYVWEHRLNPTPRRVSVTFW